MSQSSSWYCARWILVGSSLRRHKPAPKAKGQIVNCHSLSPILIKVLSALQSGAVFSRKHLWPHGKLVPSVPGLWVYPLILGILSVIRRRLRTSWLCKRICSFLWCWLLAGQSSRLAFPLCLQTGLPRDDCKGGYFGIALLLFCLVQNNSPWKKTSLK